MTKKLLIAGASGMLGKNIVNVLKESYQVIGIDRDANVNDNYRSIKGDLTDLNFLENTLADVDPDIIINCAAIVNVDLCEKEKSLAHNLHVKVSEKLASHNQAKFIYISTDSVFDGREGNYTEESKTNPLNYYAATKLEGEKVAMESCPRALVLRTNIYGFNNPLKKSLAEWAINELNSEKEINGFSDIFFNPLYTKQLAKVIKVLIEKDIKGILNVASTDKISKYDFLKRLSESLGLNSFLVKKSAMNSSSMTAKRPSNSTLNISKLKNIYNEDYLTINEGLKEFKTDFLRIFGGSNEI